MQGLNEFLAPYQNRMGYATIYEGIDPRMATYNFQNTYDLDLSTVGFYMDELFE